MNFVVVAVIVVIAGFALYSFIKKPKEEKLSPQPVPVVEEMPPESTPEAEKSPEEDSSATVQQDQSNSQDSQSNQATNDIPENSRPQRQGEATPMSGPEIPGPFPY